MSITGISASVAGVGLVLTVALSLSNLIDLIHSAYRAKLTLFWRGSHSSSTFEVISAASSNRVRALPWGSNTFRNTRLAAGCSAAQGRNRTARIPIALSSGSPPGIGPKAPKSLKHPQLSARFEHTAPSDPDAGPSGIQPLARGPISHVHGSG